MSSTSERPPAEQTRTYDRASSVVFLKTDAPFGGLSNMAGGFPLHVQGTRIYTSEALYQACRFPHLPEVQRLIIGQASPMTAKMKSKPHRKDSRPDWDRVRVKVMRWCLRVKLAQNWAKFSDLLLRTGDRPIVEESRRDDFWGAKPVDEQTLVGMNVLGRLLMELREAVKAQGPAGFRTVEPPDIPEFLFLGRPIGTVGAHEFGLRDVASTSTARAPDHEVIKEPPEQIMLFDSPGVREGPATAYAASPTPESTRLSELKPYPAMKDSGVTWLGAVPEHWKVQRLRNLTDMRVSNVDKHTKDDEQRVRLCNYVDVYKNDYIRPSMRLMRATATRDEIERFRLAEGDVLITKDSEAWNDIGVPALVRESADDLVSGYHLALLRPFRGRIVGEFLFRSLQSTGVQYQFHVEANGVTRYGLSHAAIKSVWLPAPPPPEQAAIVRFLDHADRRIRRYIRAKQKLIKLLEEQKQAIIHRAVTRGLDPNVRLKPSGVEWLGDVPEHWEILRAKHLFREVDHRTTSGTEVLLSLRMHRGLVPHADVSTVPITAQALIGFKKVAAGQIVMNRMRAAIGMFGIANESGLVSPDYAILEPIMTLYPNYFLRLFKTPAAGTVFRVESKGLGTGSSGFMRLYTDRFGMIKLPVPPEVEQRQIVEGIVESTLEIERTAERVNREIRLLHEYRTRLIADVVTGKLDVREAAARLPEETEELEPLDETEALGEMEGESAADDLEPESQEADA
jgi:type I restriction enzyme S subunit